MSKYNFEGKKVLVTGAGQGIGRSIAIALHSFGADVYALSKTKAHLDSLKLQLCSNRITTIQFDLSDVANIDQAIRSYFPFHCLVNNAGIQIEEKFVEVQLANFDAVFNVNFKAPMFLMQSVTKCMIDQGIRGSVVNISSQASKIALPAHCSYSVSKAALDNLTKFAAWELGEHGIRVNSINPTVVLTEMGRKCWSDNEKGVKMLNTIPLGKFAEIDDVVNSVLFLLSEDSSMITGTNLLLDGGTTLSNMSNKVK